MLPQAQIRIYSEAKSLLKDLADSSSGTRMRFPNLILLDFHLSDQNAPAFMNELLRLELNSGKPLFCFVVSWSEDASEMEASLNHPFCSGFISKPLNPDKFAEILDTIKGEIKATNF